MMRGLAVILSRVAPGFFLHPDDPRGDAQWQGPAPASAAPPVWEPAPQMVSFDVEICGRTDSAIQIQSVTRARSCPKAWVPLALVTIAPVITEQGYPLRMPRSYLSGHIGSWCEVHLVTMPSDLARKIRWW